MHLGRPRAPALTTGRRQARFYLSQIAGALDDLPDCKALIKRFQGDAGALMACQEMLKTRGLAAATVAQCAPLIDTMPTVAIGQEFRTYLAHQLGIATTLGLAHVGVPISSDAIESLFGWASATGWARLPMRRASPFACQRFAGRRLGRKPSKSWGSVWATTRVHCGMHVLDPAAA